MDLFNSFHTPTPRLPPPPYPGITSQHPGHDLFQGQQPDLPGSLAFGQQLTSPGNVGVLSASRGVKFSGITAAAVFKTKHFQVLVPRDKKKLTLLVVLWNLLAIIFPSLEILTKSLMCHLYWEDKI